EEGAVGGGERPTTAAGLADAGAVVVVGLAVELLEFGKAAVDRRPGQAGGGGNEGDAAAAEGQGFASRPAATCLLVKQRCQHFILALKAGNLCGSCHNHIVRND